MWTNEFVPASVISPKAVFITCLLVQQYCDNPSWKNGQKKKKNTTWVEACLQNTNDKFAIFQTPDDHKCVRSEETSIFTCVFKHFVGDNNSDQSAFITVVICIKTYFNISGNSFRHFSQLSIYDISEKKKIRKLIHRERRTLPNKPFIVGYDATEFVTWYKMAAIMTATFGTHFKTKSRLYFGSNRLGIWS